MSAAWEGLTPIGSETALLVMTIPSQSTLSEKAKSDANDACND